MLEIKEFKKEYSKGTSKIIYENLYTINIKDYGKEYIDKIASFNFKYEFI